MKIAQIINNNVVSVEKNGQELVVMGRGIAFKQKVGAPVDKEKIEKVFTLEDKDNFDRFKQLLFEIPLEYFGLTEKIIKYAENKLDAKFNEGLYISLTDHINCAIERHEKGMDLKNGLLFETKQLYRKQFDVGLEALKMIEEKIGVTLLPDEAAFLAIHFVNAETGMEIPMIMDITKLMQEIYDVVIDHFLIKFDEDSINFHRFMTHVKFFAQRLFNGTSINDEDDFLYQAVKLKYPEAHECVKKINSFLESNYNYEPTTQESLYLTMHIERLIRDK